MSNSAKESKHAFSAQSAVIIQEYKEHFRMYTEKGIALAYVFDYSYHILFIFERKNL